jgi:UDP-GlcNAc:undecaprenyl-phosphate GlcNAc-1-phosphate transferase
MGSGGDWERYAGLAAAWLVTAGATFGLAALAPRLGWIDQHGDDPELRARKPRRTPVPLVGGAALLAGLCASLPFGPWAADLPWPALLAAFALGSLDDRLPRGLTWRTKLFGQLIVALLLALPRHDSGGQCLTLFLIALLAQNAANTFDNADGALPALAALALRTELPVVGALLGLLPANLLFRRGAERVPHCYLGDAGSHVVGILWAATPSAWPVLLLPCADLLRLAVVRLRAGHKPWQGDRQHLAHRLEARGLPPVAVVLVLVGIALPSAFAAPDSALHSLGWFLTVASFLAVLGSTRAPRR